MNLIKRHKGLAIIGSLSLILLIIMFIIVGRMFFNENNSSYGDRLNGLPKVSTTIFTKIEEEYGAMKEVENISSRVQGKIIYTTIKFKDGTKAAKAKELANKILEYYEEETLKMYDFGFYLIENKPADSKTKGFIIAGNKHPDNKSISWTE